MCPMTYVNYFYPMIVVVFIIILGQRSKQCKQTTTTNTFFIATQMLTRIYLSVLISFLAQEHLCRGVIK